MVSTPSSSLQPSNQRHHNSSDMLTQDDRQECKTTLLRTCHPDKALYIFIAPWSSPSSSSRLRPSLCWLPSLLCTSKFVICFILIFSHLVISSHAEKVITITIVITRGAKWTTTCSVCPTMQALTSTPKHTHFDLPSLSMQLALCSWLVIWMHLTPKAH